jgi:uncharacterized membrane protein
MITPKWTPKRWPAWLVAAGLPIGVFIGLVAVHFWAGAGSDCGVFWAGDRFGSMVFTWPALSLGLWASYAASLIALRQGRAQAARHRMVTRQQSRGARPIRARCATLCTEAVDRRHSDEAMHRPAG